MTDPAESPRTAPDLEMQGKNMQIGVEQLSFFGRLVQTQAERIKLAANAVDAVIHRISQKLRDRTAWVEGADNLQAGYINRDAKEIYTMRSKYTVMSSDEDVKIDAEHIHLG